MLTNYFEFYLEFIKSKLEILLVKISLFHLRSDVFVMVQGLYDSPIKKDYLQKLLPNCTVGQKVRQAFE